MGESQQMPMLHVRVPQTLLDRIDRYVTESTLPEMKQAIAVRLLLDRALKESERKARPR